MVHVMCLAAAAALGHSPAFDSMGSPWITFDCYGTLVDWHTGFSRIMGPLVGERTKELLHAYHDFERQVEAERPYRSYKDVLTTSLLRAARKVRVPLSEAQARTLPQSWAALPVFADVEPALSELRSAGYKLGVLTNCDDDLFEQTNRRFRQPFDMVITAERIADYKPSLSHFRQFSQLSGVAPANWIHVACSWFHDLVPARELGIARIWLDRDLTGEDPTIATRRLTSATDLARTVKQLRDAAP